MAKDEENDTKKSNSNWEEEIGFAPMRFQYPGVVIDKVKIYRVKGKFAKEKP